MCDEFTAADEDRAGAHGVTRRTFGTMAGAAGLAMVLPLPANALPTNGRDVVIDTPDGQADAYFVAPASGRHPGVLMWPDIMGLRPTFRQMADRLAASGYAVLCVNQFYRSLKAPILPEGANFAQPAVRAKIQPYVQAITPEGTMRDAAAFLPFLDRQKEVDKRRGIATTGYCMGGPMTMRTAAVGAGRVKAGASFHGANLVNDQPNSPHLLVPKMRAAYLFAIAENDDQRSPGDKDALRTAFAAAKLPAEVEVYQGANHGWCVPDSRSYNQAQAERAWTRMLALFQRSL